MARTLIWATALLLVASPAAAADEIGLSVDGVSWSSSLTQPLFDPAFLWVPGDDETSSFYVRNQGPTGAELTVAVRSADSDKLLADDDISLWARVGGGSWTRLDNGSASSALIAPGSATRVDVRVRFAPASLNQSESKSLHLSFGITLAEAPSGGTTDDSDGGDQSDDSDDSDDESVLPGAGSAADPSWLWLAAGLICGGTIFVRRPRRKDPAHV